MRQVLLLRGINIGPARRIPMAQLRALLGDAGYADVATYVQSGNVVLSSDESAAALEARVGSLVTERFSIEVQVISRTEQELAAVLACDPIPEAAGEPKRYQVTFLAAKPRPGALERLASLATGSERVVLEGRELYSFHPDGIARSKLALGLTAKGLGVSATARNWTTVRTLQQMASQQ